MIEAMLKPGGIYIKCGMLLEALSPKGQGEVKPFAMIGPPKGALLAATDSLSSRFGQDTITIAAQDFQAKIFDMKRSQRSSSRTMRMDEMPVVE